MARTKQRRTYLPKTFPAVAGTQLRTRKDGGLSKPRPRLQRATGPQIVIVNADYIAASSRRNRAISVSRVTILSSAIRDTEQLCMFSTGRRIIEVLIQIASAGGGVVSLVELFVGAALRFPDRTTAVDQIKLIIRDNVQV